MMCFTICMCMSPGLDVYTVQGTKNETLTPHMFHDTGMFVHKSGLGRVRGTKNETLTPARPTSWATTGLETQIRSRCLTGSSKYKARYYKLP